MHPILFEFGTFKVFSYGFMIMMGVVAAFTYLYSQRQRFLPNVDKISELILLCFVSVFVGGKFFYFLEKPTYFIQNPSDFFANIGQGFVFYGSFLFTIPALYWWLHKNQLNIYYSSDFIAIAGSLVHGFGKVGCFMAGCCHGKQCDLTNSFGLIFNAPHTAADPIGVPLYPVQLWDALLILSISVFMIWYMNRKKFQGELFLIYTLIYAVGRFITENYRGDDARGFVFGGWLSHSQFIALLLITISGLLYIRGWKRSKTREI
jgi:phosphatidylglycerol:prolipoprotein diacylglycerol transferase